MTTTQPKTHRPKAPGLALQLMETRVPLELATTLAMRPLWRAVPRGDGHSVLVFPGLGTGDEATLVLRRFLDARGYTTHPWDQGLNLGLREGVLDRARETVERVYKESGRKISLIGWSLGGVYARELAKEFPHATRLVISMGSPFTGHPRETNAWRLYEFVSGHKIGSEDLHEPLRTTPPVPTTSIWSRTDGIVSWRCSIEHSHHEAENIIVDSSHCGLGLHPAVLFAIADRLAQAEGEWKPFHRGGLRSLFYGDPRNVH